MTAPQGAADPDDMTKPLYGATFGQAVRRYFRGYVQFSGRASRSEYWWPVLAWYLAVFGGFVVFSLVTPSTKSDAATTAFGVYVALVLLATLLPSWAVFIRRLHDADRSGWWSLMLLIPYVGNLATFVFGLLASNPAGVRFDASARRPRSQDLPDHGTPGIGGRNFFD